MKNLIIRSFGNADIYFDNVNLADYNKNEFEGLSFFEKTKLLVEKFEIYKDKITFNLFDLFYSQILNLKALYDFVGIFTKQTTNQNNFDTFYLYKLFKLYIQYKGYDNIAILPQNEQIFLNDAYNSQKIIDILNIYLLDIKEKSEILGYNQVLVNITGGTKIVVLALFCVVKSIFSNVDYKFYYGLWDKYMGENKFIYLDSFNDVC